MNWEPCDSNCNPLIYYTILHFLCWRNLKQSSKATHTTRSQYYYIYKHTTKHFQRKFCFSVFKNFMIQKIIYWLLLAWYKYWGHNFIRLEEGPLPKMYTCFNSITKLISNRVGFTAVFLNFTQLIKLTQCLNWFATLCLLFML